MLKKSLVLWLLFISFFGYSQKQNNIWYFGANAGLDFNTGIPVSLTNGQINTVEGCASIADAATGNLLFYTDGVTVFNSNHTVMPNGSGLAGGNSSSQSALIIPLPGSSTIYYIFTVPDMGSPVGFSYSLVDMTLQGGLGDVTVKNTSLHTPVTEKLYGTKHQNGTDYWVVVHENGSDAFYSYLFSASGINTIPVISNIGLVHTSSIGYMKISTDGAKLVMCINATNELELFDFNNLTGIVSNPITFPTIYINPYGLEFSPDNSKLYVCEAGNQGGPADIYQFDLLAGTPAAILASAVSIGSSSNIYLGPLQTGPDCKIYVGRFQTGYLGVINDPNQSGVASNYVDTAIYLGGKQSLYGLPNQLSVCFGAASVEGTCLGDSTYFNVQAAVNLLGTQWDFDDPASGANNVSYILNPVHYFAASGTYQVQLIKFYTTFTDTLIVPVTINPLPIVNLGSDTILCPGTVYSLNAGSGFSSYSWQDNSTDSIYAVSLPGVYFVTVSSNGCYSTDTVTITTTSCNVPNVSFISSDTTFCDKKCIDFFDLSTNSPTSWQWFFPGAVPASDTLQNPVNICYNAYGTFDVSLIACNGTGCDTLHISSFITEYQLPPQPVITQSNDTLYCSSASSYAWYDISNPGVIVSTNPYFETSTGGSYFVIVGDSVGCQSSSAVFEATGISQPGDPPLISVFPNPAGDFLNIESNTESPNSYQIHLTDIQGRLLLSQREIKGSTTIKINLLTNGIYFLHLESPQFVKNIKLVISH